MGSHSSPVTTLGVEALETRNVLSKATLAVAMGILKSPEEFQHFIISDYKHLLGRAPDQSGLSHFVGDMELGATRETIEADLASSKEYRLLHGNTATGFITGLYQDLLGRLPNALELNVWLTDLANGASVFSVAKAIGTSPERDVAIIQDDYALFLGRSPGLNEVVFWLNQFQAGADRTSVAAAIIASDEFFAEAANDPSTYITHVYQDLFLRTPAQTEINFWLNVYNQNKP
ncbi:MAG TPA: DUF4214 domain-containing protein [Gemmataceae bacterium]|nr:DUF4214 domain-containing protein [Gemmataceae bacterium]